MAHWVVRYAPRFPEWHEKSRPYIEDSEDGTRIPISFDQQVNHPGHYDLAADILANLICSAMNKEIG